MEKKCLLFPQLGPELASFQNLGSFSEIGFYTQLPFERGNSLNRIKILGSNAVLSFGIPLKKYGAKSMLGEIQIDYIQKWQNQIWRSLVSCYRKSPYFGFYERELEQLFYQSPDLLVDFTIPIHTWLLNQYFPKKKISVILAPEETEIHDFELLPLRPNGDEGMDFNTPAYPQVFGQKFVGGLSVWDSLFCMGPNFGINKTV
jgi:hypothetical protein